MVRDLARLLDGVDAVVHLAWLIQPNHERDLLRRTNVDGTDRVARACALAGVTKLVVASSVGAYSPVAGDELWDEEHATNGVPTSHYSVDKAAQERVLDVFEAQHPEVAVVRLRPALIFQSGAGSEIYRYFLGPWLPGIVARQGLLPVMPWPRGLRFQAVHADDVAQAYLRAVLRPVRGAFNIAADDVLRGPDVARILDHGRLIELPHQPVRVMLTWAWRSRIIPTDPGWLDMGAGAPLMDTSRAREELGWEPTHSAADAVRQVIDGIEQGHGKPSPPLMQRGSRPDLRRGDYTGPGRQGVEDGAEVEGQLLRARIPDELDRDLLGLYLSDHITGATAGLSRVRRMAQQDQDLSIGDDLELLSQQLDEERNLLIDLMAALDLPRLKHRQAAAWVGERIGRLKLNRRLASRPTSWRGCTSRCKGRRSSDKGQYPCRWSRRFVARLQRDRPLLFSAAACSTVSEQSGSTASG